MKITHHGSYLTQLTRWTMMNAFLVREDDGFTLIDTGMGGMADGILAAAAQLGAPIRRILLTHAHGDHVGSLDALHQALPDAEVIISARDARFLRGDMSLDADEPQTKLRGGYVVTTTVPTRLLHDGDRVGSLLAIATPGHMSFIDTRDGTLIAGDAFTTKGGLSTGGTFRLLFPLVAMATWNKPTAIRSAERLIALNPSRLAVGHGITLENPVQQMQQALNEAYDREGTSAHAA